MVGGSRLKGLQRCIMCYISGSTNNKRRSTCRCRSCLLGSGMTPGKEQRLCQQKCKTLFYSCRPGYAQEQPPFSKSFASRLSETRNRFGAVVVAPKRSYVCSRTWRCREARGDRCWSVRHLSTLSRKKGSRVVILSYCHTVTRVNRIRPRRPPLTPCVIRLSLDGREMVV